MSQKEAREIVIAVLEKNVDGLIMSDDKMNKTLEELGVDSLDTMIVVMDIAEAVGVEISDDKVEELNTPEKIVSFIS